MNIYQFTAANPTGQTDVWTTTENLINKQKNNRIIMQGDLNCAHPGCRWDYAQPLNKDLGTADNKLEHFLKSTSGHFYAQQEHTWKGKECRAALDHVLTWNYHLPPQTAKPNPKSHKKFDHCQIWTQLPHLDFPKRANTARTTQPDFSQRIDTVFFKRHVDDWKVRIKMQIQGDLDENPTGQALADLIHKERKILAKEVRWLQDKAWKARRRASERREHRNKTQNTLLKRISLLTAALTETAPLQPKDRIKGATRRAMQGLGFLHLRPTFQKLVRQHVRWKALLTVEIGKAESLMEKENLKQSRRDDRRDIGRKKESFKHGIKGIKKITGKYNTSKPLTEVKISCPCGLKWKWQDHASPITEQGKEARTLEWTKECTANFRTHSLKMTQEGMEIKLETLTDMLHLLQATQNPPLDLGTRSLIYDIGPWKGENLPAGIETFFQKNAYHPFATRGNLECGKAGPIPMSTTAHNTHPEQPLSTRSIEHFCEGETCFTTDPTNFRSN